VYRKLGREVKFCVLGEFNGFTLICEENLIWGIGIWSVLGFWSVVHVGSLRGGAVCVLLCVFGGIYLCASWILWTLLTH
jgi:hypothetical protein